jgi:D-alanyl-D-alanine carboxypeptidase.
MSYRSPEGSRDISELIPPLFRTMQEFIRRMKNRGYACGVSSTYRTIADQNILYNKGGVTQVRGGYSYHNHRMAADVFHNVKGDEWNNAGFWKAVEATAIELGLEWGGWWTGFVDKPHLQLTFGLTCQQLLNGAKPPTNYIMGWEKLMHEEIAALKAENTKLKADLTAQINTNTVSQSRILTLESQLKNFLLKDTDIIIDGETIVFKTIMYENLNHVGLRDIVRAIMPDAEVGWDSETTAVTITLPKQELSHNMGLPGIKTVKKNPTVTVKKKS